MLNQNSRVPSVTKVNKTLILIEIQRVDLDSRQRGRAASAALPAATQTGQQIDQRFKPDKLNSETVGPNLGESKPKEWMSL